MRPRKVVLCLHRDPVALSALVVVLRCWGYRVTTSLDAEVLPAAVVTDAPLSDDLLAQFSFPHQGRPAAIILFGDHELDTPDVQARTMAELREQLRIAMRRRRGPLPSTKAADSKAAGREPNLAPSSVCAGETVSPVRGSCVGRP